MFSRKCALDVTPLDETPFLYEEELILGISMEKKGWKTVYDPNSVIHHLHGNSTEKVKHLLIPAIFAVRSIFADSI